MMMNGRKRFSETWPRLYALVNAVIIFIIMRLAFLLISLFFSTFLNSTILSQEFINPPNTLPPLFPPTNSSLINLIDINNGSMNTLNSVKRRYDVAMVMMYAPWCVNSQKTAKLFMSSAKNFNNTRNVIFIAVNCWEVTGTCRQQEGLTIYPRLLAYRKRMRIEFFGRKSHIDQFVMSVLYPLIYVTSVEQLYELVALKESVIVGHFDFSLKPYSTNYINYYLASVEAIKTSPLNGLRKAPLYCVVSDKQLATYLTLSSPSSIYWITMRPRGIYIKVRYSGRLLSDRIHQWSLHFTKVVKKLVPAGNMSLGASPFALLFVKEKPFNNHIITTYNHAALVLSSLISSSSCSRLSHLYSWYCLSPHLSDTIISLPICQSDDYCPIFNPLFPNSYYPAHLSYCQESTKMGVVYGGWPLPCSSLKLQFFIIDSLQYSSLGESLDVVTDTPTLLIGSIKDKMIFSFPITNHTTIENYITMTDDVIRGYGTPVFRSSPPAPPSSNFIELNSQMFLQNILSDQNSVYLVVHYAPWCVVCTAVWPQVIALTYHDVIKNNSLIKITRINGDLNDLPSCHSPSVYPSLALYPLGRKQLPIWFPFDKIINVDNLIEFIVSYGGVVNKEPAESKDNWIDKQLDEWADMGWLLWETAEKERQILQKTNQQLNSELARLHHHITRLEATSKERQRDDMNSLLGQFDTLLEHLLKGNSTASTVSGGGGEREEKEREKTEL